MFRKQDRNPWLNKNEEEESYLLLVLVSGLALQYLYWKYIKVTVRNLLWKKILDIQNRFESGAPSRCYGCRPWRRIKMACGSLFIVCFTYVTKFQIRLWWTIVIGFPWYFGVFEWVFFSGSFIRAGFTSPFIVQDVWWVHVRFIKWSPAINA